MKKCNAAARQSSFRKISKAPLKILFAVFAAAFLFTQNSFGGEMEVFNLNNGVKVLFNKTDGIKVVSVKVYTPVSVICENPSNAGISYMTVKLMSKATLSRSNEVLAADIDNIGAELSADADYDIAGLNMSFLSEYFQKACEILSDVLINPSFDEQTLKFEKNDICAVLKSRKDSIFNTASDNFIELFYAGSPYSNPVLGKEESVELITPADLKEWHSYSYNASNIIISISGNIDAKTVKENLNKYFADIKTGKKFEKPSFSANAKIPYGDTVLKGKFNQAYIFKGFAAPAINQKDFVALKVTGAVLGGRMTSRLFTELREKLGLAYETSAIYPSRVESSFFVIYIGLDKKNIDLTLKKMDEILNDLRSNEISQQELSDIKAYIKGMYVMDRQTVNRQSYYYAWRELTGQGYKYDDEYLADIDKITTKDIYDAANRIFSQKALTLIINPDESANLLAGR